MDPVVHDQVRDPGEVPEVPGDQRRVLHQRHGRNPQVRVGQPDAAYVALAELLAAPLVTLDARISRATGPRCPVLAYQPS